MNQIKRLIPLFVLALFAFTSQAQIKPIGSTDSIDYLHPKDYTIGAIEIKGLKSLDKNVIKLMSGLYEGQKIKVPGDATADAIKKLWKAGFFDDVKIYQEKVIGNDIFLTIELQERPRLSKFSFKGVKKNEADDIREKVRLVRQKIVTDYLLANVKTQIKEFYVDKGYYNADVEIISEEDKDSKNKDVILTIKVTKGKKVRIEDVVFYGNTVMKTGKLRRKMKETKRYRWYTFFNSGKFLEENYEADKPTLLTKYLSLGYRDARIAKDTFYFVSPNRVKIEITMDEGRKYYFRNISWLGNSKFRTGQLDTILGIKKGDTYDQSVLEQKLYMNPSGIDVSSLYMDDGYLFFQVNPTETNVENDSIDMEIHIYEGKQAIINKVTVVGNTKTNDHVIYREIRTRPGQLFRRSDIMRTQRELSQLGYFDPEKLGVTPTPNAADGTVDIEYKVEEKPSDQLELSGGWGAGQLVGTLGVSFNNFSARNFFKKGSWQPLPSGDGQKLSIRAQSSGVYYQSYNASFTEPWLGGKKPNSLSFSVFKNVQSNGQKKRIKDSEGTKIANPLRADINITGVSMGFGKRLKWPDDYFSIYAEQYFGHYNLHNYTSVFTFGNGVANNIRTTLNFSRNSLQGNPIFPTGGSNIVFSAMLTPPYSAFNKKDYSVISDQERYKFLEYQKYKFTTQWYMQLTNKRAPEGKEARNLILRASYGFGILGMYNKKVGVSPFERFYLGGSGLTGFALDGREIIALRGYQDNSIAGGSNQGAAIISKYTMELRYPISLNPQATVFALAFAEAGNAVDNMKQFQPFNVKRSAGAGVRIFLPMFGLLGFDYGWNFDKTPNNAQLYKGQFHFTIGAQIGEL
ncbi:MAG: outer membrane protein assembly factor BamA [Bacteroidota bacterium]|nr:outer membrane protein assembly factor BamA [Bacteroidota bacterium]